MLEGHFQFQSAWQTNYDDIQVIQQVDPNDAQVAEKIDIQVTQQAQVDPNDVQVAGKIIFRELKNWFK